MAKELSITVFKAAICMTIGVALIPLIPCIALGVVVWLAISPEEKSDI